MIRLLLLILGIIVLAYGVVDLINHSLVWGVVLIVIGLILMGADTGYRRFGRRS